MFNYFVVAGFRLASCPALHTGLFVFNYFVVEAIIPNFS